MRDQPQGSPHAARPGRGAEGKAQKLAREPPAAKVLGDLAKLMKDRKARGADRHSKHKDFVVCGRCSREQLAVFVGAKSTAAGVPPSASRWVQGGRGDAHAEGAKAKRPPTHIWYTVTATLEEKDLVEIVALLRSNAPCTAKEAELRAAAALGAGTPPLHAKLHAGPICGEEHAALVRTKLQFAEEYGLATLKLAHEDCEALPGPSDACTVDRGRGDGPEQRRKQFLFGLRTTAALAQKDVFGPSFEHMTCVPADNFVTELARSGASMPRFFLASHRQQHGEDSLLEENPVKYALDNSGSLYLAYRLAPESHEDVEAICRRLLCLRSRAASPRPGHNSRVCNSELFIADRPNDGGGATLIFRSPSMDVPSNSIFHNDFMQRKARPRFRWCTATSTMQVVRSDLHCDVSLLQDGSHDYLTVLHALGVAHVIAGAASEVHSLGIEGVVMPHTCFVTASDRPDGLLVPLTTMAFPSAGLIDEGLVPPDEASAQRFTRKGDSYRLGVALSLMLGLGMPAVNSMGYAQTSMHTDMSVPAVTRLLIHELTALDPARRLCMKSVHSRLGEMLLIVSMGKPSRSLHERGRAIHDLLRSVHMHSSQVRNIESVEITLLQTDELLPQLLQETKMLPVDQLGLQWQVRYMMLETFDQPPALKEGQSDGDGARLLQSPPPPPLPSEVQGMEDALRLVPGSQALHGADPVELPSRTELVTPDPAPPGNEALGLLGSWYADESTTPAQSPDAYRPSWSTVARGTPRQSPPPRSNTAPGTTPEPWPPGTLRGTPPHELPAVSARPPSAHLPVLVQGYVPVNAERVEPAQRPAGRPEAHGGAVITERVEPAQRPAARVQAAQRPAQQPQAHGGPAAKTQTDSVLTILPGQDIGGIFRDTMVRAMEEVTRSMFEPHPDHKSGLLLPKFDPANPKLNMSAWTEVGKLAMKCVMGRVRVHAPWCSVVFRGMLNETFVGEFNDLLEYAPSSARSLMHKCFDPTYADHKFMFLLRCSVPLPPVSSVPSGPFQHVASVHNPRSIERWLALQTQLAMWGPSSTPPLPPGTSAGDFLSQQLSGLRHDARNAIVALRHGFTAFSEGARWMAGHDSETLRHLLSLPSKPIDVDDLIAATQIAGCAPTGFNLILAETWRCFSLTRPLEDLVFWATGARSIPEPPHHLVVLVVPGDAGKLPTASTCMLRIVITEQLALQSPHIITEKLLRSLELGGTCGEFGAD